MINDIITIDLEQYGDTGVVEVARPTFRKQREMKNALSKSLNARVEGGESVLDTALLGDVEIIRALAHIKKAPFPTDIEGFTNYCDALDMKRHGAADDLFQAILKAVARITESPGPLGPSP